MDGGPVDISGMSWDHDRAVFQAGRVGEYLVDICPMIFNHRVVLTPQDNTCVWDVGWCFASMQAAVKALQEWDPAVSAEPPGYLKRVGLSSEVRGPLVSRSEPEVRRSR